MCNRAIPLYKWANNESNIVRNRPNLGLYFNKFWPLEVCKREGYKVKNDKTQYRWQKHISWEDFGFNWDDTTFNIDKQVNGNTEPKAFTHTKPNAMAAKYKQCGNQAELNTYQQRISQIPGVKTRGSTTQEPLITGFGLPHMTANSLAWHPTLGVPYIPGSTIKGLVRDWTNQWCGVDADTIKRIFGSDTHTNDKDDNQLGSVIFFDALPVHPVKLKQCIMTPHYQDYYSSQGTTPPSDNRSPVPISFLAVNVGCQFCFSLKARDNSEDDIELVSKWLTEALAYIGIGAKTAVGFGRMSTGESISKQALSLQREYKQNNNATSQVDFNSFVLQKLNELQKDNANINQDNMFESPAMAKAISSSKSKEIISEYLTKVEGYFLNKKIEKTKNLAKEINNLKKG